MQDLNDAPELFSLCSFLCKHSGSIDASWLEFRPTSALQALPYLLACTYLHCERLSPLLFLYWFRPLLPDFLRLLRIRFLMVQACVTLVKKRAVHGGENRLACSCCFLMLCAFPVNLLFCFSGTVPFCSNYEFLLILLSFRCKSGYVMRHSSRHVLSEILSVPQSKFHCPDPFVNVALIRASYFSRSMITCLLTFML